MHTTIKLMTVASIDHAHRAVWIINAFGQTVAHDGQTDATRTDTPAIT